MVPGSIHSAGGGDDFFGDMPPANSEATFQGWTGSNNDADAVEATSGTPFGAGAEVEGAPPQGQDQGWEQNYGGMTWSQVSTDL